MWRITIKIRGKYNNYVYKWEYFGSYEEVVNYLATHKLTDKQEVEAFYIKMFENE